MKGEERGGGRTSFDGLYVANHQLLFLLRIVRGKDEG